MNMINASKDVSMSIVLSCVTTCRVIHYFAPGRCERTSEKLSIHYANVSVRYTAIFHGCKNDNFQMKIFEFFLIFAQNIDCGYTLEQPQ